MTAVAAARRTGSDALGRAAGGLEAMGRREGPEPPPPWWPHAQGRVEGSPHGGGGAIASSARRPPN
eukprot:60428-Pyramimonas_sp.AAC.1